MNIGITVYNPLAGGLLTGKHSREKGPEKGTRFDINKEYYDRFWRDSNFNALEELKKIAADAGKSMTELALQWLMSQPHVDSVILGASKIEHLQENLSSADGKLDVVLILQKNKEWLQNQDKD